jgi:peptidoglycan-associated lipoprotein
MREMRVRAWTKAAVLGLLCVAMFSSGCSWFRRGGKKTTGGPEDLPPYGVVDEGGAMGSREAGAGERISPPADAGIENVLFDYDSYQIKPSEMPKVERAAQFLKGNANVTLVAEGNCDERGSNEYNMSLGEHRADAVRAALIGMGIEGGRLTTKSYGEENPLDPGHGEAAWRANRRVEFGFYR